MDETDLDKRTGDWAHWVFRVLDMDVDSWTDTKRSIKVPKEFSVRRTLFYLNHYLLCADVPVVASFSDDMPEWIQLTKKRGFGKT